MPESDNQTTILQHDIPEPTTYFGNKYFEINFLDSLKALFKQSNSENNNINIPPPGPLPIFLPDWSKVFAGWADLPFKGRQDVIDYLNTLNSISLSNYISDILTYGYPASDGIPKTDIEKISKLIILPSNFEGLDKIQRNLTDEILGYSKMAVNDTTIKPISAALKLKSKRQPIAPGGGDPSDGGNTPAPDGDPITKEPFRDRTIHIRDSIVLKQFQKITGVTKFDFIASKLKAGNYLVIYKNFNGQYDYKFSPIPEYITPRLFIIEKYKLSSFLGDYGIGRTIKTFSLLPGEKTTITVKTYKKTVIDSKESSSILDSFTQESADDFEDTLNREQSNKSTQSDKLAWHAEAEADASWGFGSAKISGGASGETASQREEMAKSVSNAVKKHSQKASSKRDVQVDTSYEKKEETGEETSIEREIENINVSRTLNFIFKQMNQEFISLLHLVDAKIGYSSGLPGSYQEVSISSLGTPDKIGDFLNSIILLPDLNKAILNGIIDHLAFVLNYKGEYQSLIERKKIKVENPISPDRPLDADYIRVKNEMSSIYENVEKGYEKTVEGIIVSAQLNVMRTEGIIAESVLGEGDALDSYSHGLQDEAVKDKQLSNDAKEKENAKQALAQLIIDTKDEEKSKLYQQIFPCCPPVKKCNCDEPPISS